MILLLLPLLASAQEAVAAESVQREVRLHGVAELIAHPQAGYWLTRPEFFQGFHADARATALNRLLLVEAQPADEMRGFATVKEIEELATRFCQPPVDPQWERIQADESGWLVGYLRPEQHEWLARFLQLQADAERRWMAQLESHWFTLPDREAASLVLDGSARLLGDEAEVASLLAELERRSGESRVSPRLSAFPGQRAELSVLNEVSYVKEYRLEIVEPGNREIADPVVDVIQEGHWMELRALQTGDGSYGLRLSCSSAEVERPIPTRRCKLSPASSAEVEIAMPQVLTAKVDATVLVPDGGGVLLLTSGLTGGRSLAVVVQFRRVAVEEAAGG
jgi:hypothetical protein